MTKKKHMQFLKKYHHSLIDYDTTELWENVITVEDVEKITEAAAAFGLKNEEKPNDFPADVFSNNVFFHVNTYDMVELYLVIGGYG